MSFRPVNARPRQAGLGDNNDNDNASVPVSAADHNLKSYHLSSHENVKNPGSYPLEKQTSNADSQATALSSSSTESNRVFTPPIIERSASNGVASSAQGSSQESQLLQLSQLAAAQEKMPDLGHRTSVKRMADGAVKDHGASPGGSPVRPSSHSRNVSGISATSTSYSNVTELSSELKARLSYAMLKVNNGWQSRTFDEVEHLASASASPASSNSTLPGPAASSTSPQVQALHHLPGLSSTHPQPRQPQAKDTARRDLSTSPATQSASARQHDVPSLAPPVSIQPHRSETDSRRNSNPNYTPNFLSPRSHHTSPHTPALPSINTSRDPRALRAAADPVVISPSHNNREKDAMEALIFMSGSPGNSANLKNRYPGSQPVSSLRNGASAMSNHQRRALPTSAPKRKSLPNGRPMHSSQPLPAAHSPKKRVGFGKSPSTFSEMDIDDPASPRRHATFARPAAHTLQKTNGATGRGKLTMPVSTELSRPPQPKPRFSYEDLDNVLDQLAAEDASSDSEAEIELPARRGGADMRRP